MKTKSIRKMLLGMGTIAMMGALVLQSCKDDETPPVIDPPPPTPTPGLVVSKKVTAAPTIDGTIDAMWANSSTMECVTTVPDPGASFARSGCGVFEGYEGDQYTVKIRSAYDASNVYFLVEWNDPTESKDRDSWYFDATSSRWKMQSTHACSSGVSVIPHYEDKFSFMWNINVPAATWESSTCYTNCHTGLSTPWSDAAKHYTTNSGEMTDVWHWKFVRTNIDYQLDDQYWGYADPANPPKNGGRYSDAKTSGGYGDNKQDLPLSDNTSITVSVPKYVIPGKTGYYWITNAEVTGGTAKLVTAVNSAGVLTYSGGTIDPTGDSGYAIETGTKRFPSIYYTTPWVGSRGDVSAYGKHTGSGWVLEIKRALNTGNSDDVTFDGTSNYLFGIGVFDNAGIAHSIKTNLTLDFE